MMAFFFFFFFVKTVNYLAPKISIVLCRLVRIGDFSLCWRVGNITPVFSLAVPILVLVTIALLPSPLSCLKFLSACWLSF